MIGHDPPIGSGGRGRPERHELYRRLRIQVGELRDNLGGLPRPDEARDLWREVWFLEAHHSTALEGNTLILKQVERLLDEGRAVGNAELREYLEVKGYAEAADRVYRQAGRPVPLSQHGGLLTRGEVREVHRIALTPVWQVAPHPDAGEAEEPGNYRRHDLLAFHDAMTPVTWPLIPAELGAWVDDVNSLDDNDPVFADELASLHCRFEQIHPFIDGNGRCGRLVLNLILVRLGYPPVVIYKRDRARYLRALRRADIGAVASLAELLTRAMLDSLYRFVLPAVAGPARLVPLEALAEPDLKFTALRAAAGRGRLQATKGPDGRWRSSTIWVNEYRQSRYRRA